MPDETEPHANDEAALIDFVSQREVFCPVCRYNLRYLTRASCPECGNALKLTVGTVSQISRAWLVMVIALLVPSGIGVLSGAILMSELRYWSMSELLSIRDIKEACIAFSVVYCIVCIPFSTIAICTRRRFILAAKRIQWVFARVFVLIDTAILLFFFYLIS